MLLVLMHLTAFDQLADLGNVLWISLGAVLVIFGGDEKRNLRACK